MKGKGIKLSVFILVAVLLSQTFIVLEVKAVPTSTDATANGVAVDSQNNVIVTGQFYDVAKGKFIIRTEKYDGTDGHLIWRKDYDAYNYNIGKAIAVDANDNIIIAGVVNESILQGFNYILIKYDKNGNLQWAKTFNNKIYDVPWRIAIDSGNHIFVTGMSLKIDIVGSIFSGDYWTIKCDSNGNLLKSEVFDVSNADLAFGIAITSNDNVVITGSSNSSGVLKYCTIEYDNNLNLVKGPIYYGPNDENSASGVAIDSSGNIFVAGASGSGGDKDYVTVKYKKDLSSPKSATYSVATDDDAIAIDVDNNDNVIVTGTSNGRFCTLKYDNSLKMVQGWPVLETFIGGARDVVVDSNNNVIVTGYKGDGTKQYYTIKYDPNGNAIWKGGGGEAPSQPPKADFTWSPLNPTRSDAVHFYDKSSGSITTWSWNFGDGTTSNEREPFHTYANIGTYDVTLTVSGPLGTDTKTKKITVSNAVPIASFIYGPNNPFQGHTIQFTDQSTDLDGSIVNWTWNFGDGNISYEKNPTHVYTKNGTYTVILTVMDNDGATKSTQRIITVNAVGYNMPPVANFVYSPSNPAVGKKVTFDASSSHDDDGIIELYSWDWNSDGIYEEDSTKPTADHTWYQEGEYTVTLRVEDNNGTTNTFTKVITVGGGSAGLKIISAPDKVSIKDEKTFVIKIQCLNKSINDVSLSVLNGGALIINITPSSMSFSAGETKQFAVNVKLPSGWNESERKIEVQAIGEGGVKSNVVEITITTKENGTPSFTFLLAITAIALVILSRKKIYS